jgi:hypothetical protein
MALTLPKSPTYPPSGFTPYVERRDHLWADA